MLMEFALPATLRIREYNPFGPAVRTVEQESCNFKSFTPDVLPPHSNNALKSQDRNSSSGTPPVPTTSEWTGWKEAANFERPRPAVRLEQD